MLLVVCATDLEARAVLDGLAGGPGRVETFLIGPYRARACGPVTTVVAGIGPAAAGAATAVALTLSPYDAVISAGIAGGFGLSTGTLVVADPIVPADLGVQDGGWRSFAPALPTGGQPLAGRLGARCGPVLTVSTVTSTDEHGAALRDRFPGALAEAMEGYGVAHAATTFALPCHEVRAISNEVGLRDRAAWDVSGALAALRAGIPALVEELEPR